MCSLHFPQRYLFHLKGKAELATLIVERSQEVLIVHLRTATSASAFLCMAASPAFGQTLGVITGEIRDTGGGAVVGAVVTATNRATGATRSGMSNEVGGYSFPSLQPGVYDVNVNATG